MKPSDRELVSKAQKGDTGAFEKLVFRYDRKVLSIAHSFTRDADDAQDIYQEVFLRIYRALPDFRFESQFSTWVYRITMNVCLSHKRRDTDRTQTPLEAVAERDLVDGQTGQSFATRSESPEQYARDGEIRTHIERALESLSPQERLVFTLKHFEGYKLREIASMMECGEGTVKRYMFTGIGKLKKKLGKVYR
jgi:RNA polymerase sigma-70 factor (ECF subfamily)